MSLLFWSGKNFYSLSGEVINFWKMFEIWVFMIWDFSKPKEHYTVFYQDFQEYTLQYGWILLATSRKSWLNIWKMPVILWLNTRLPFLPGRETAHHLRALCTNIMMWMHLRSALLLVFCLWPAAFDKMQNLAYVRKKVAHACLRAMILCKYQLGYCLIGVLSGQATVQLSYYMFGPKFGGTT